MRCIIPLLALVAAGASGLTLDNRTEGTVHYTLIATAERAQLDLGARSNAGSKAVPAGVSIDIEVPATVWSITVGGGLAEMSVPAAEGRRDRLVLEHVEHQGIRFVEVRLEEGAVVAARHVVYLLLQEGDADEPTVDDLLRKKARLEDEVRRRELQNEVAHLESRLRWLDSEASLYYPSPGTYGYGYGCGPYYSAVYGSFGYGPGFGFGRFGRGFGGFGGARFGVGFRFNNGGFRFGSGGAGFFFNDGNFFLRGVVR